MPAILVAKVNGAAIVVDGWHRIAALESLSRETIEAEITETTEREVGWLAAQSNLCHGLPLKAKEMQRVFRAYIKARKHYEGRRLKSYREMAADLGGTKSHNTIRNWMLKMFPKIAAEMGGHEDFIGPGGLRDVDPEPGLENTVREALNNALAAFHGVTDVGLKGQLIAHAERVLEGMRTGGEWAPERGIDEAEDF